MKNYKPICNNNSILKIRIFLNKLISIQHKLINFFILIFEIKVLI